MQRISSRSTVFTKRIVPFLLFAIFAAGLVPAMLVGQHGLDPTAVIVPVAIAAFAFFIMRMTLFKLVDEVWDGGDFLLIRNKGEEDRVPFENIMNLSYTMLGNSRRATLKLRTPCRFGSEVSFLPAAPPWSFTFYKNPLLEKLIERIDEKRRGAHR
jgi:hypothetical protein